MHEPGSGNQPGSGFFYSSTLFEHPVKWMINTAEIGIINPEFIMIDYFLN